MHQRRATQVLSNEGADPIDFEAVRQDDGFYMFSFPGADEYDFQKIIKLLKINGINAIGADTALDTAYELNENKIMKLKDLLTGKTPLHEQFPEDSDYFKHTQSSGTQMTGDAFGKPDLSGKYDPGNEPLEIQYHGDQQLYYIDVEDIEAYVNGETVWATDPDRGMDDVEVNRENSDVSGVSEEELEDFLVSGDRSADDIDYDVDDDDRFSGMDDMFGADLEEGTCTEKEIREGTCGYAPDGEVDIHNTEKHTPAGPELLQLLGLEESEEDQKRPNPMESADDIIAELTDILDVWEEKEYESDEARYKEYYKDIDNLVTNYKENKSIDNPLQENKIRQIIRKMIRE